MSNIFVTWESKESLVWNPGACAERYNVYWLPVERLIDDDQDGLADNYGYCIVPDLTDPATSETSVPPPGWMFTYIVTGTNTVGEGSMGDASNGAERINQNSCP